jgi:hypothetical protein
MNLSKYLRISLKGDLNRPNILITASGLLCLVAIVLAAYFYICGLQEDGKSATKEQKLKNEETNAEAK